MCASKYIHTVVGHLVSRPWGPGGGAAAPSRNLVQDFAHRLHREMGANPCPQAEAGPTPPEGWGGGVGRRQVHNPQIIPCNMHPNPCSRHSSDVLPKHAHCPLVLGPLDCQAVANCCVLPPRSRNVCNFLKCCPVMRNLSVSIVRCIPLARGFSIRHVSHL